jgi:hypothetical protein
MAASEAARIGGIMRRKCFFTSALVLASAAPVFAGYTAVTNTTTVSTPEQNPGGPTVGDTFATTTPGSFATYIPDTPNDPQITQNDLSAFRYTLNGSIQTINTTAGLIDYTGNYSIFYDINNNNTYDPGTDPIVSAGTFTIDATFIPLTNDATLVGTLTQTTGPAQGFADLSEGGHSVNYTGTYMGTDPGVSGTIQGTLTQTAVVPEPASLGLIGIGSLGLLRRRRQAVR